MGISGGDPNGIFVIKLFDELRRIEGANIAGHHSPNVSNTTLCNTSSAEDKRINYGTAFNANYTTCP